MNAMGVTIFSRRYIDISSCCVCATSRYRAWLGVIGAYRIGPIYVTLLSHGKFGAFAEVQRNATECYGEKQFSIG